MQADKPENIIKNARESKQLTQQQVADSLGIGLRSYQHLESGRFPKNKITLILKLEKELNIAVYDLIYYNTTNISGITTSEKTENYGTPSGVKLIETEDDINKLVKEKYNAKAVGTPTGTYQNKTGDSFTQLSDGRYIMFAPLVKAKARAGYLTGWGDEEYIEELPKQPVIVDKPHKGEYISFEVVGDSMDDGTSRSYLPGDIVTGRKIDRKLWRNNKLHLKSYKAFIIVTLNGVLVKEITEHSVSKNTITIHSYNPDKAAYPDEEINLDTVMQILNIVDFSRKQSNKK